MVAEFSAKNKLLKNRKDRNFLVLGQVEASFYIENQNKVIKEKGTLWHQKLTFLFAV